MIYRIYNPHGKPIDELPLISGFNNGGRHGTYSGVIIAQDGTVLGGHICSNEHYMLHDLGVAATGPEYRRVAFEAHYPDGCRTRFVSYADVQNDPIIQEALRLNKEFGEDKG